MPEGDTIYRTARALSRALVGKPITRFETAYAQLARANDEDPFLGQTIDHIEARGKWLLIHFSHGNILVTHMLMSGSWHIYRPGERWQESPRNARIVIETPDYLAVGFRVPMARIHTAESLPRDRRIPPTTHDVLRETFNADEAVTRLMSYPDEELAHVLLRQKVLAGVGNAFKSEICFLLGLSPFRKVATLSQQQAEAVVATARRLLAANVLEDSGDNIVTYKGKNRRTTRSADPGANLWVYGRKGKPCRRCGTPIERCLQGPNARPTYWCPHCQPDAAA
jgi:endonuclease-8